MGGFRPTIAADTYQSNFMPYKVHNQYNDTSFTTEKEETILQAALRNGRLYPYGCQSGVCGTCKTRLLKGSVEHLSRDPNILSDEELANGTCLACQAVPQEDIEIEVKEIAKVKEIEVKTMPTRVREKNLLADDVVQLFLSVPKTHQFDFLPGQYLKILLKNGKERSFSIANTPNKITEEGLELHVRVVPDGHYSPQVKDHVAVKDIIRIQGPFGTYFLRKEEQQPIMLVAGGTGFAPIKALVEDAIESDFKQAITLYWGVRTETDLYQDSLARQWLSSIDNFTYVPVLSEEHDNSAWSGERGFVHEAILRHHSDISEYSVYASGPPVMIDALEQHLPAIGLNPDFFYTDRFDYAAESE